MTNKLLVKRRTNDLTWYLDFVDHKLSVKNV